MNITITDPELLKQFEAAGEDVSILAPDGRVLGRTQKEWDGKLPPGFVWPVTDEQRAEMRKHRTGRPLKDIIRDLEEKHGSV